MDKSKTLEVLENDFWIDPDFKSSLVVACHQLRKIPLKDLSPENLRLLIGQEIGLNYLVPIALDILEKDLLASGDMYDGDLLCSVARIKSDFWDSNEGLKARALDLTSSITSALETLKEADDLFKGKLSW
ncbi:contact-dependent growth inhibition system immunity protein [Alteromonas sp. 009811495]|uniref:contact-dependent growth inhibition system immunity protein n=1 Tax=Alteromonas sp. 009811495 TaxID=3002962 RepID=UPI00237EC00A|nr:contact-dependent growth inhibition system immunity protein [Alteromonas sp. 009811495]WDT87881.1 contact-dependent growth inhibition system immunity protein [Alteromonas sp. 009811495]